MTTTRFPVKSRRIIVADGAEQVDGCIDILAFFSLNADLFVRLGADRDIHRVIFPAQLIDGDLFADLGVIAHLHAGGKNAVNVLLKPLTRKAVIGDAVTQHAAQLGTHLKHGAAVPHQLQVIRRAQAAGAAAHNRHALARGGAAHRRGHHARMVHRIALETADVDG